MKSDIKFLIHMFAFVLLPTMIFANTPSTSCPSGYIAVDEEYLTIATSCPSDTIAIGDAESCLVSNPSGDCIMYTPVGVSFTDDSGTYEYTEPCAMQ